MFQMAQRLQHLQLFDFVVVEAYLGEVWAILQNLQPSTQSVRRQLKLLQVFKLWEAPEVGDGGVAEVEGLKVGELAGEALDVNVAASLHSAEVEVAHLRCQNCTFSRTKQGGWSPDKMSCLCCSD